MTEVPAGAVLITGTSSGIGLACAIQAAQAGLTVVATMRDVGKAGALRAAAAAAGVSLDIRALDITDPGSVTAGVDEVVAKYGALAALVNNAGAGHVGTIELETVEDVRAVLEVNFIGTVAMTKAAMPHLRASRGRLISVTSVGGVVGQPFNEAYCAAKFAVEGFMESLAPVAATVGVQVCVIEPGAVATSFVANIGIDPAQAVAEAGPYAPAMTAYLRRTAGAFAAAQTQEGAAETVVAALTAPAPVQFRWQTSDLARQFVGLKLADGDGARVVGATTGWVGGPDQP
jgi:NAD(P)-dependent dehydrogenase (short-subunit alcohol dehydrogenase family)